MVLAASEISDRWRVSHVIIRPTSFAVGMSNIHYILQLFDCLLRASISWTNNKHLKSTSLYWNSFLRHAQLATSVWHQRRIVKDNTKHRKALQLIIKHFELNKNVYRPTGPRSCRASFCSVDRHNSLPNEVVHAESTNTFKSRLNKFWSNQEITTIVPKFKELEVEV